MIYFVTSFSQDGFKQYAKNMLESVIENWKSDLHLVAYYHDCDDATVAEFPKSSRITYRNLNDVKDMLSYRERMKKFDGTMDGKTEYNWRMDAVKWCHKVYALTDFTLFTYPDETVDWVFWLDADTVTTAPFSKDKLFAFIEEKAELVHLGRKDVDYSETSFMGFNLKSENISYLLADLRGCYDIGEVIAYREWHDGFIFERLLKIYTAHGLRVQNLTPNVNGLAAFAQAPLADYMKHFKGNLKHTLSNTEVAPDVSLPRYRKLADLVRTYAKDSILDHDDGGTDRASAAVGRAIGVVAPDVGVCRYRRPRARPRAQAGHAVGGATTKTTTPGMVPGVGRAVVGDVTHAHR